jgi:hypothetical protein
MTNSKITWDYGSTGRFVSAESFVKVWQTSDSIVDLQHKLAKDCSKNTATTPRRETPFGAHALTRSTLNG